MRGQRSRALLARPIRAFFEGFNRAFERLSRGYGALTRPARRASRSLMLVVYAGLIALTGWQFARAPTGFIPQQDQGYLITVIQLPPGASLARTDAVVQRATEDRPGDRRASRTPCPSPASTAPPSPTPRTPARSSRGSRSFEERAMRRG